MNLFLKVRDALGLSQEALAQLLGVSLSHLKLAETNRRTLPGPALQRLVWMLGQVDHFPNEHPTFPFTREMGEESLHKFRKQKREVNALLHVSENKWKQMHNRLAFLADFQQQFPAVSHPAESMMVSALTVEAQHHLQHADVEKEMILKTKQVGLAAMIRFLEDIELKRD